MGFEYVNKKGQKYYLHSKIVVLRNTGKEQKIYFFSKNPEGSVELPEGYKVVENPRTGLPFLKKI